ncbi:serine/threonine protein kinase [Jatrophihabitans sp. GAS493]|uniref:serine/threonine-protein kinase n=1 Tax=Jatrophihabitans sp. GAS493 TaxID=1907575 RepID=UPI000BB75860|nr:serine/threonine-protein kinase [Jatrophihabitans sp. GAS493]SOD74411.1 serine/threonine protein kinase [Jatrophihabitans sp. GAS493]
MTPRPGNRRASPAPSWRLDGYAISERLGVGGSAEVWRARAVHDGRPVALKRLRLGDPAQVRAARTEAALLTTLDHPHLIRLHRLAYTEDHVVLVLELAVGGSLRDLLSRRRFLTVDEAVAALAPVGVALAYAHQHGVVHGDVTPGNVLFTAGGAPLLADLGVARIAGAVRAVDDDPVRCTAAYLEPAVARGGAPTAASDVFMLAATLLHALTGEALWRASTTDQALHLAATADLADLDRRVAPFGVELATLIVRALSIESSQRPTAAEFALDLRRCGRPSTLELNAGAVPGATRVEPLLPILEPDEPSEGGLGSALKDSGRRGGGVHRATRGSPDRPPFTDDSDQRGPGTTRPRRRSGRAAMLLGTLIALLAIAAVSLHPRARGERTTGAAGYAEAGRPSTPDELAAKWLVVLDELREQAYATNNPGLLGQVYDSAGLRNQDAALLATLAPRGCRLIGVRTTFADVHAEARLSRSPLTSTDLVVTSSASLAPSTLVCGTTKRSSAPGQSAVTLRTTLRRVGSQYRISGQTRV